jgi:broad specificity polyphosphatase/5'/3'-nucleotidase SurE
LRPTSSAASLAKGMPRDVLINVNFPDCAPDEVKRIAVTAQGRRRQERLHIDKRKDGRGNPYYWIAYVRQNFAGGGWHRSCRARRALHRHHAAQARHDRRALHDEARRIVRLRRSVAPAVGAAASMARASASD